jgi:hypothetical protein
MLGGGPEHRLQVLAVRVDRAGDEDASAPRASEIGLNGESADPAGVDFVILPSSEVGEYWPLVSP